MYLPQKQCFSITNALMFASTLQTETNTNNKNQLHLVLTDIFPQVCRVFAYWISFMYLGTCFHSTQFYQGFPICQALWTVFIPIPKKDNAKECSNYCTIGLISHSGKIMLKILQARLQQFVNRELPDVQAGFRKRRALVSCIQPGLVICFTLDNIHETSARGWCTGKTHRDGMGRVVGGGSGWGKHVNPWLVHVSVWQKSLQYCKVTSLQLIKINEKN